MLDMLSNIATGLPMPRTAINTVPGHLSICMNFIYLAGFYVYPQLVIGVS